MKIFKEVKRSHSFCRFTCSNIYPILGEYPLVNDQTTFIFHVFHFMQKVQSEGPSSENAFPTAASSEMGRFSKQCHLDFPRAETAAGLR